MRIHSHGYLDTGICILIHSHYSRNPAIMEDDHSLYVLKAALLAGNLFLHGRVASSSYPQPDSYSVGREYSHVFDNPSDEVIVNFSETPVLLVIYNRCTKI